MGGLTGKSIGIYLNKESIRHREMLADTFKPNPNRSSWVIFRLNWTRVWPKTALVRPGCKPNRHIVWKLILYWQFVKNQSFPPCKKGVNMVSLEKWLLPIWLGDQPIKSSHIKRVCPVRNFLIWCSVKVIDRMSLVMVLGIGNSYICIIIGNCNMKYTRVTLFSIVLIIKFFPHWPILMK